MPGVITAVVTAAKAGDMQAARIFLDRVLPVLRAEAAAVAIDRPAGTLTEQAAALFAAAAEGHLPPDVAAELIGALGGVARVAEVDELRRRLDAIEHKDLA